MVKNPPPSARDVRDAGSIPGSGRSSGGGRGNPLQYSCLENPMHGGAWAMVQGRKELRHDSGDLACMHIHNAYINEMDIKINIFYSPLGWKVRGNVH